MRNPADIYQKIVVWSEEDNCYIGTCPELFYGGVHGDNELEVFKELCEVVDEWVEIIKEDEKTLPKPKGVVLETI
ncbi:MAG: hypothetical protein ACR2J3_12625 [Aridibacter sp.]